MFPSLMNDLSRSLMEIAVRSLDAPIVLTAITYYNADNINNSFFFSRARYTLAGSARVSLLSITTAPASHRRSVSFATYEFRAFDNFLFLRREVHALYCVSGRNSNSSS